ncbi:hypothetical protein BZA05DRAFT_407812 [Tricharina praecox]|uniref:uncharacterized protein n=1 Tax=Tricharina praecox TaxID=43433 RepID=UPI00221E3F6F|nr:uncharacterized protein BZA05DRAFT_407812 [Tricharina praecox]KAI5845487.1 hypothetical protein BZA05DRAFT_407812 [Tricharina praecox]
MTRPPARRGRRRISRRPQQRSYRRTAATAAATSPGPNSLPFGQGYPVYSIDLTVRSIGLVFGVFLCFCFYLFRHFHQDSFGTTKIPIYWPPPAVPGMEGWSALSYSGTIKFGGSNFCLLAVIKVTHICARRQQPTTSFHPAGRRAYLSCDLVCIYMPGGGVKPFGLLYDRGSREQPTGDGRDGNRWYVQEPGQPGRKAPREGKHRGRARSYDVHRAVWSGDLR